VGTHCAPLGLGLYVHWAVGPRLSGEPGRRGDWFCNDGTSRGCCGRHLKVHMQGESFAASTGTKVPRACGRWHGYNSGRCTGAPARLQSRAVGMVSSRRPSAGAQVRQTTRKIIVKRTLDRNRPVTVCHLGPHRNSTRPPELAPSSPHRPRIFTAIVFFVPGAARCEVRSGQPSRGPKTGASLLPAVSVI
jgi:hypothetical protein